MKKPHTLYLLADGTHANPADCERDDDGVLRHIYGMAVALNADGEPETVSRGAIDNKNVEAAEAGADAAAAAGEAGEAEAAPELEAQPVTEVDPATGKKTDSKPAAEPAPKPKANEKEVEAEPAKPYKNREIKGR